jgi:protein NirF
MIKTILLSLFILLNTALAEKVFVVERENSALSVIENDKVVGKITQLRDFNHAVVKFKDNDGYVITRDGYVIKFDPKTNKKQKEYKTSKSAIGFVIGENYVAVANYDNQTVEILTRDLNPIQTIKTHSKNVGIKIYNHFLIFAAMDNDEVWVMKDAHHGGPTPKFKVEKIVENAGSLPFDAMINQNLYVVGFFNSTNVGVLDLITMKYKQVTMENLGKKGRVLKVPHFGFWSISKGKFFIPAVGAKNVNVFDYDFNAIKSIHTQGMPVFTSLSPDKKYLCVTYSGKDFPTIQIVDTQSLNIIKTLTFDGKVLHVRWSKQKPVLYVSVNDTSKLEVVDTNTWKSIKHYKVPKPSGIFIY